MALTRRGFFKGAGGTLLAAAAATTGAARAFNAIAPPEPATTGTLATASLTTQDEVQMAMAPPMSLTTLDRLAAIPYTFDMYQLLAKPMASIVYGRIIRSPQTGRDYYEVAREEGGFSYYTWMMWMRRVDGWARELDDGTTQSGAEYDRDCGVILLMTSQHPVVGPVVMSRDISFTPDRQYTLEAVIETNADGLIELGPHEFLDPKGINWEPLLTRNISGIDWSAVLP